AWWCSCRVCRGLLAPHRLTSPCCWRRGRVLLIREAERAVLPWVRRPALPALDLPDGWHDISPQKAEDLLKCNEDNRPPAFATVKYYARQMRAGVWIPTGQPIIISNGRARDHQHRSWAAYLSGCTFNTYFVNVPHHPMLFAYLDNGRPRSARDALTTAGLDGVANVIASGVRVAQSYDQGAFTVLKTHRVDRPTPAEVLQYVQEANVLGENAD